LGQVVQRSRADEFPRHRHVRGIAVEAHRPAPGRDSLVQQLDDPSRPAAEVDRAIAGSQCDPFEQG
jgi:hypothetical protein